MAKKSATVVPRKPRAPARRDTQVSLNAVILLGLVLLVVWLILRSRQQQASYTNVETWKIQWDRESMLPIEVEVHRDAKRK